VGRWAQSGIIVGKSYFGRQKRGWSGSSLCRHAKDKHQEQKEAFKLNEETIRKKEKGDTDYPAIKLRLRTQRSLLTTTAITTWDVNRGKNSHNFADGARSVQDRVYITVGCDRGTELHGQGQFLPAPYPYALPLA